MLSPTAVNPLAVQPPVPLSAPSAKTVVPPEVSLTSSTKKPLPPAAPSVAYRNRRLTVLPA
jgi:hypothetical protein